MSHDREWKLVNSQGETTSASISSHFKIFAPPGTDVWRPSLEDDRFNAPFIYTTLKSAAFKQISATISADWNTQFDQGGLLLYWPGPEKNKTKWVKAGIEYFNGQPMLGVVGCDRFSDWSLCPLPIARATHATVEAERVGQTLWVYLVFNGERRALREIKWAFLEDRENEAEMWVGAYAAKEPLAEGDSEKGLEVIFRDMKLETS